MPTLEIEVRVRLDGRTLGASGLRVDGTIGATDAQELCDIAITELWSIIQDESAEEDHQNESNAQRAGNEGRAVPAQRR